MRPKDPRPSINKIAEQYFDYMAKNYPVMCLSDEFYFFPRVKKAIEYLNILDSLDQEKLRESVLYIKDLKSSLEKLDSKDIDLEARIDLVLLKGSMSTFIREFNQVKIWQIDPSLYLKILLLGINQILVRFSFVKKDIDDYLLDRISKIPQLLDEAKRNLKEIPYIYLEVAMEMVDAAIDYFKNIPHHTNKILKSLTDFKIFLKKLPARSDFIRDRALLESILRDSFFYKRTLSQMFDIASKEYHHTLEELSVLSKDIDPGKTWQEVISIYKIDIKDEKKLLELYSSQIERIKKFIKNTGIITIPPTQDIRVSFTPKFMKPIRASASYCSPVTNNSRESGYFYITSEVTQSKSIKKIFSGIHNEYIFVTAHETYPGHHLLDSIRRNISNPIRQQIESPFFYEGWASYAERLIDNSGYIDDPREKLVGLKRQAWRAARAMLDIGIRIGKLNLKEAELLLKNLGYESRIVKAMSRHYVLSPGYQLCYTIGKFEIDRLKEKFVSKFGLKRFHDFLLQGGQIPF
ncbi:MAG: DUF885 domain-containing protein, partial [Candidatus Omnitrophica bacterium]|nr:DUF885 domain-containing protein [Candidatus Omnitrophota bacterium]